MAGPEAVQEWINKHRGLNDSRGPYRPGHSTPHANPHVDDSPSVIPVAFLGRVSTDDRQDPVASMLRQLAFAQDNLPEGCVIVAHYYDVETGRKDLDARGRGHRHERWAIPIPRTGSIQDLLAQANSPDCPFQAVMCEQIDRIARKTYYGTLVEHQLQKAGIPLWAADEHIAMGTDDLLDPTSILTRRVKQGISEWYALDLLKRARGGYETHTDQGYNIGKPCYGYRAVQVTVGKATAAALAIGAPADARDNATPHTHGAQRGGPRVKTKLVPDPTEAAVVRRIYEWRVTERLGYQAIADRLNADLTTNPPPVPPDPSKAIGRWTASNVREVLSQPKYTGYMVWNRRASKTRSNSPNPIDKWVWSSQPTHEAIIDDATFVAAQQVVQRRQRSRTKSGANTKHPDTKRSYLLRSYLFCDLCGRRMFGKTRRGHAYYACAPRKDYTPDNHPDSLWVRESALIDQLHEFLAHHVFGSYRQSLLASNLRELDRTAEQARTDRINAIKKAITDLDARKRRLLRNLEVSDNDDDQADQELIQYIKTRRLEIKAERDQLSAELDELEEQACEQPNPDLLQALPIGSCDLQTLPEHLARRLFEALRLEIHYNKHTNTAVCKITLTGETIPAVDQAAGDGVVVPLRGRSKPSTTKKTASCSHNLPVPICCAPPTRQYTNPNLLVNGPEVTVKSAHAKIRRDGYRRTR